MLKTIFKNIYFRVAGLRSDCQGFVVMSTLAIFLFLFVLCASIYAVGETIHQRIKLQNACDAAAYSAAVVQADGLSRMACVNRAMAWSYVQMTNRQMDYISYRWLKLTCKRFDEDLANAKKYNAQLIMAADMELGGWAIMEAIVTGVISEFLLGDDIDCAGIKNGIVQEVGHQKEGHGWWSGLEFEDRRKHNIRLNVLKDASGIWDKMKGAVLDGISSMVFTRDMIGSALSPLKMIDTDDSSDGWGGQLGKLIDYDKKNIGRMNNALERINNQMNISMKMTAENVLKAMLKDNRFDSGNVLKDYYISIHIPEAANPYENMETRSQASASFFSPLRNTEVDEMLFLNMISTESANKSLYQHFPVLLGGDSLAYGLDQWFIRGTATYSDGKDHCLDSTPLKGVSFDLHIDPLNNDVKSTTFRDEGALGIQRVYKDTNLNESGAGFFAKNRKRKVGEHPARTVYHLKAINVLAQCCKDNGIIDNSGSTNKIDIEQHDIYEDLPDTKRAISRGNHLMDWTNVTNAIFNEAGSFFGGNSNSSDEGAKDQQDSMDELNKQKEELIKQRQEYEEEMKTASPERKVELQKKINDINTDIDTLDASLSKVGDIGGASPPPASAPDSGTFSAAGNILMEGVKAAIGNLLGNYLDIQPSCGNDPKQSYRYYPMCQTIKDPTTALYSEYRWGACKWYCLTSGWTYFVCTSAELGFLFQKNYDGIYCDKERTKIAELPLLVKKIKIRGSGNGHYGWPKWFCGYEPYNELGIDCIPPVHGSIGGRKHGYMEDVLADMLPVSGEFFTPIKPLWDEDSRYFSRTDYNSCAMFPDGLGDFIPFFQGHNAWPGLIRGHARIYADDKEIFDNRYVGAKCKPWVLNEKFFAGEGTIVVGAAMKHTNPFVQLFNFLNTKSSSDSGKDSYRSGTEMQKGNETTVLSAFNIPENNFMWTMSAARAGVRHRRRNGAFDQERQYQVTYDSTADIENLDYSKKYLFVQDSNKDSGSWSDVNNTGEAAATWSDQNPENKNALSRIYFANQTQVPIWNGCPCGSNSTKFKNMWNLCETDWDATLLPLRYAGQKAVFRLSKGSGSPDLEDLPLNEQDYNERRDLIQINYELSASEDGTKFEKNDRFIGNGKNWMWDGLSINLSRVLMSNPFINGGWKRANSSFFEDLFMDHIPGAVSTGVSTWNGLNLENEIPEGKDKKKIDVFTILKDRIL